MAVQRACHSLKLWKDVKNILGELGVFKERKSFFFQNFYFKNIHYRKCGKVRGKVSHL